MIRTLTCLQKKTSCQPVFPANYTMKQSLYIKNLAVAYCSIKEILHSVLVMLE